ncbi:MAG: ASKHA domain-containing protein [Desulfovibrio sp.]|nr:ASKHA domain-containing protein [Desulfovibrio sp.]
MSEAVFLSGLIPAPALCAGHALCGRCRLRIIAAPDSSIPAPLPADLRRLSEEEIARGFRLACRHKAEIGMLLEISVPEHPRQMQTPAPALGLNAGLRRLPPLQDSENSMKSANCVLALDLGTTTLHWRLLSPPEEGSAGKGTVLWEGMCGNPQAGAGSDVISRLAYAQRPGGAETLRSLIRDTLRDIARQSRRRALAAGYAGVGSMCVAGNPVMSALLLGREISGSAHAPEFRSFPGEDGIPGLPPLIIPPQLSSFVGGDIAAGYASLVLDPATKAPEFPFFLADMGTNGEFLLALTPDSALTASVALGPALEGAGLYSGIEACPGAAADFLPEFDGLKPLVLTEDFDRPGATLRRAGPDEILPGMTGTACLALLHILRRCGSMSREGFFTAEAGGPLGRFFIPQRGADGECFITLGYGMRLYASDVESVLKVKAAFSLGMQRLLAAAVLNFSDLSALYLAGSLGRHVRTDVLEGLGFIPPGTGERLRVPGNTSLAGAELLLRRPATLEELRRRAAGMRYLDPASDSGFADAFAASMYF